MSQTKWRATLAFAPPPHHDEDAQSLSEGEILLLLQWDLPSMAPFMNLDEVCLNGDQKNMVCICRGNFAMNGAAEVLDYEVHHFEPAECSEHGRTSVVSISELLARLQMTLEETPSLIGQLSPVLQFLKDHD